MSMVGIRWTPRPPARQKADQEKCAWTLDRDNECAAVKGRWQMAAHRQQAEEDPEDCFKGYCCHIGVLVHFHQDVHCHQDGESEP